MPFVKRKIIILNSNFCKQERLHGVIAHYVKVGESVKFYIIIISR